MKKKKVIGKVGKTKSGLRKVFEIKDGKVTIGKEVGRYAEYDDLIKWLLKNAPDYISIIVIEGHEIIIIRPLPAQVILKMPPNILKQYKELMQGGESKVCVHTIDCTLYIIL